MTLITGSIPLDTLIGSVVTTGAATEHAREHEGHVTGFRISLDGRVLISFSTGIDLVWQHDEHLVPSFNLQSTPNHMWSENQSSKRTHQVKIMLNDTELACLEDKVALNRSDRASEIRRLMHQKMNTENP